MPEAWGGTTVTINTSAKTGEGLSELLEMLALQAEVLELKANPSARARGIVIESELHKGLGAVATILVQNGTLHLGEALVFNDCYGKVKTMHNEHNQLMKSASPSVPALITGLSSMPKAGDPFVVVKNEKTAKEIVSARIAGQQKFALQKKRPNFDAMLQNKKILKLIIKADVQGSIEALASSVLKIVSDKVSAEILSSSVGEISESDIRLAAASKAVIIGFHTGIESHAESLIKNLGVKVHLFNIIYHAVDAVKEMMTALLDPIAEERNLGAAEIKETFKSSQLGTIYGCLVSEGVMTRNQKVRVVRNNEVLWKGNLSSLKRIKEDVKEVKKGLECGILLEGYQNAQVGDILQCYEVIYHPQKL
ncbi:translation-initiation factor 2 family protein [Chlamydia psittaci 84-8471/1]|nr:translation-initiation factor 2 family protein [Chlamydia psittaci 84-8471/1]